MSPYDRDCLQIVSLLFFTNYAHSPNETSIEHTDVWKRGWELHQTLYPIVPHHQDPFYREEGRFLRCKNAYLFFHCLRRRLPAGGDVLRREEIEEVWGLKAQECDINRMRAAWTRRLPQFACPVKFEQGKIQLRSAESKPGQAIWEQYNGPGTAPEIWPLIAAEATTTGLSSAQDSTAFGAVVFRVDDAGSYYVMPLKLSAVKR